MDEKAVKRQLNLRITLIVPLLLISLVILDTSLGLGLVPRLVTRFCYNSPNPTTVNSQCVLCNYYLFDSTLLGCTGSSALNINITASQAFCVISQCLGQLRQSPVFLGRKKRSDDIMETLDEENVYEEKAEENNNIILNQINELNHKVIDKEDSNSQIVYKLNQDEHFIVAKEVEALIIDLPETMDDAVFAAA